MCTALYDDSEPSLILTATTPPLPGIYLPMSSRFSHERDNDFVPDGSVQQVDPRWLIRGSNHDENVLKESG